MHLIWTFYCIMNFELLKSLRAFLKKFKITFSKKKPYHTKKQFHHSIKLKKKNPHRSYTNPAFIPIQIIQLQLYEQNKNQLNFESK